MEHHPTDAEKQTQGLCGATSPPAFMTNVSGGLSPAGERNIVVLMLGGAKSPIEFMINVVGGEAREGSPKALFLEPHQRAHNSRRNASVGRHPPKR